MPSGSSTHITTLPASAIEGGRVTIRGVDFATTGSSLPEVSIGGSRARVVYASPNEIAVLVPAGVDGSGLGIVVDGRTIDAQVDVAAPFATGLHQVDNPVFDRNGNLYVTYSGTRGQQVPVSIFRVRPNGTRETFATGLVNPTSMALGPDDRLYVSSRFEGSVYRLAEDGSFETFATDLGIACGLAFTDDGMLFVGDRSGTIFRVSRTGHASTVATLPSSVAAFHLALGPDGALYVSGPTLSSYDAIYRIDEDGGVSMLTARFGRPQGLAFDPRGRLHVVEALAGVSGVYRLPTGAAVSSADAVREPDEKPELVVSGPGLVGLAFSRDGSLVVCSNETAYRLPIPNP